MIQTIGAIYHRFCRQNASLHYASLDHWGSPDSAAHNKQPASFPLSCTSFPQSVLLDSTTSCIHACQYMWASADVVLADNYGHADIGSTGWAHQISSGCWGCVLGFTVDPCKPRPRSWAVPMLRVVSGPMRSSNGTCESTNTGSWLLTACCHTT